MQLYFEGELDDRINFFLQHVDYKTIKSINDIQNASYILYPNILWAIMNEDEIVKQCQRYCDLANRYKKPLLVFIVSDSEETTSLNKICNNLVVFRVSLSKKNRAKNEFTMPYVWENCETAFTPKQDIEPMPIVGFCGLKSSHPIRNENLDYFHKSKKITSNYIVREKFWGGKPNDPLLYKEFYDNIEQSHFVMTDRGNGNFSMRFFQTLSAGRIPVINDSNIPLPFADQIDYDSIIIRSSKPRRLLKKVIKTYKKGKVIDMQKKCRQIYDEYLSPIGFAKQIEKQLMKK